MQTPRLRLCITELHIKYEYELRNSSVLLQSCANCCKQSHFSELTVNSDISLQSTEIFREAFQLKAFSSVCREKTSRVRRRDEEIAYEKGHKFTLLQ